ncbi:MAG: hypothetical protein ACLFVP_08340 [Candidatus Bathyarchaeia archaeon]
MLDDRAELLKKIIEDPKGVRELTEQLHKSPRTVLSLLDEMEDEGLIARVREERETRGRPKLLAHATPLGEDFLQTFRELELKPLRSKRSDLLRVKEDVNYVMRLASRGKSLQKLLLELNQIVQ